MIKIIRVGKFVRVDNYLVNLDSLNTLSYGDQCCIVTDNSIHFIEMDELDFNRLCDIVLGD
jgi:hypothetical protein